jgi:hypothetical protein
MEWIVTLWLPIVVSAVLVFVVSSIIHMMLGYHSTDFRKLAREDELMASLRQLEIPPGEYAVPYAGSMKAMKSPEYQAKLKAGPMAFMTVFPSDPTNIRNNMILWFVYCLVVSAFAAVNAGTALHGWQGHRAALHFAGLMAFAGYSLALLQSSIWWRRGWPATLKSVFDGLVYAVVTGLTFAYLWPH